MKIFIYYASAGHGHQRVAEVIAHTFEGRGILREELRLEDSLNSTPALFGKFYPAFYYYSIKYTPKLWGACYDYIDKPLPYRFLKSFRSTANRFMGHKILNTVKEEKPDVIISSHFYTAELFATAKKKGEIKSRLVTVITDFLPHNFWLNEGTDDYWVMADETREELLKRNIPSAKVHVGGIPVDRKFLPGGGRRELLEKWKFSSERFTILFSSGSFGLGPTEETLEQLNDFGEKIQCFVVCGNNHHLHEKLQSKRYNFPLQAFEFVDFMDDLMEASDLLIAKSGGATTTESLVKGIPMVVMSPIPGQESRNAALLKKRNAAFFMEKSSQINTILQSIFDYPEILKEKRIAMAGLAKPHAAEDFVSFVIKGNGE